MILQFNEITKFGRTGLNHSFVESKNIRTPTNSASEYISVPRNIAHNAISTLHDIELQLSRFL